MSFWSIRRTPLPNHNICWVVNGGKHTPWMKSLTKALYHIVLVIIVLNFKNTFTTEQYFLSLSCLIQALVSLRQSCSFWRSLLKGFFLALLPLEVLSHKIFWLDGAYLISINFYGLHSGFIGGQSIIESQTNVQARCSLACVLGHLPNT